MKICPFMSHMLGSDGNVMEINGPSQGASGDVVVLGYDDEGAVGVKTERKAARTRSGQPKDADKAPSHLYCLRETCRFYQARDGECTFDAILENVENQARVMADNANKPDRKDVAAAVTKELDKFWKFQTKSVEELIASYGDTEKRQAESLSRIAADVEKHMGGRTDADEDRDERLLAIRDGVMEIKDTIDARNDGFETLTTTVSDLVLSFEDNLKEMKTQYTKLSERVAAIEDLAPRVDKVQAGIEKTMENLDRIQDGWTELMDVVRNYRKSDEDSASSKARRREAMKFNNLGVTSFHNGDLELARDQFLDALNRDDTFAECFNNLGLVYTELGESTQAADAFTKAININPELHAAYNNLGYVYYKQGNYQRAVDMYNEALIRNGNNSSAYTNLGNAYFKLGEKREAKRAWERAVEIDPANEHARRSLNTLD